MPCFHPLKGTKKGRLDALPRFALGTDLTMSIPCGQCIGCRLERSRQWAIRCVHEASLHKHNCFITLTYNDANLPPDNLLTIVIFSYS